jgi:hypothetical protein
MTRVPLNGLPITAMISALPGLHCPDKGREGGFHLSINHFYFSNNDVLTYRYLTRTYSIS